MKRDDVGQKVIAAVHGVLKRLSASGMLDGSLLTETHMATTALGYELARGAYDSAHEATVRACERRLAADLRRELQGEDSEAVARNWNTLWQENIGAELATLIEQAGTQAANEDGIAARLREFLVAYHEPMDPAVGAGTRSTYQSGRGDLAAEGVGAGAIYITAPALQHYLRRRFPANTVDALSVDRVMGGYSKETYIVRLAAGGGEASGGETIFVIRKDGYGLPTGSSVASEFAVLQEVYALGVPVPRPLWLETDPGPFAAAFLAVGHVSGRLANQIVPKDAKTQRAWTDNLAAVLALLHRSTAQPAADVREVLRAELASMRRRVQERERAPHPGLSLGLAWLERRLDDLAGRPACRVHGDFGFHNLLMNEAQPVGVLDWEFSHIGDPIEDLAMARLFIDQIDGWDRFLSVYEEQSGFRFEAAGARYFSVWVEVRNMIACLGSLNSLLLPQVDDVALSVAGTIYIPKYEIAVLDAVIAAEARHD